MRVFLTCAVMALTGAAQLGAATEPAFDQTWTFEDAAHAPAFEATSDGEGKRKDQKPRLLEGQLELLDPSWKFTASVLCPTPSSELFGTLEYSFALSMTQGTEGMGVAWLPESAIVDGKLPAVEKWEEPNIAGAFAVGFDASDPVTYDPFRGSGNIYNRPQHEVSLHWNGREIVKRVSPTDFRLLPSPDAEGPALSHAVRVRAEYVVGGANVSVWVDEGVVFENYFVPSMTPCVGRIAMGARNDQTAGDISLDNLRLALSNPLSAPPAAPTSVVAIDHQINDNAHGVNEATVEFPKDTAEFGRIIGVLTLDKPPTRFDPWDRIAHVFVFDDKGERFELIRYITPYHKGHEWQVDLTDLRPLLTGTKKIRQECGTQGEGWIVSVRFDFYPGPSARKAVRVVNLWNGAPEIGNPDNPVSKFYTPMDVALNEGEASAKVRMTVTGHGMTPNTGNAGEFLPIGRTLVANGSEFHNRLWKTDNYLNPCRPQGGTWKYDRAGWAPGDVVRPWNVDVPLAVGARNVHLEYTLDPYVNEGRGKTWAPTHFTQSQLIVFDR